MTNLCDQTFRLNIYILRNPIILTCKYGTRFAKIALSAKMRWNSRIFKVTQWWEKPSLIIRPSSEITLTPSVLTQSLSKVAWFHLECLRCESQRAQQKSNVVTQPFVPAMEIHAPWHDSDLSCDKMALTFFFFAFMLCLNCCVMSMIRLFLTFYHSKHQPYSFMFV